MLKGELIGARKKAGKDNDGRQLYEQKLRCRNKQGDEIVVRIISSQLEHQTKKGEKELHILSNVPNGITAKDIAERCRQRWTIEVAFWRLSEELNSEIATLAYPNAALFGFTIALIAYNTVSLAKSATRKVHGDESVDETLSSYYLTHEMSKVIGGLLVATEPSDLRPFRTASQ